MIFLVLGLAGCFNLSFISYNNTVVKYYFRNDTAEDNNLVFLELSYRYYDDWETSTGVNFSKFYGSFVSYKFYWFLGNLPSYLGDWYFYGFANSKQLDGIVKHDLYICRASQLFQYNKCNDYFMITTYNKPNQELNISKIFVEQEFNPILDTDSNGEDSILYGKMFDLITTNISPFFVLLRLEVNTHFFNLDQNDLMFEFNNTLTVFYGSLIPHQNFTKSINNDFNYSIIDSASHPISDIYSKYLSSQLQALSINQSILLKCKIVVIILIIIYLDF